MKKIILGIILTAIVIGIFLLAVTNPNLRENKETWFGFIDVTPEQNIPVQKESTLDTSQSVATQSSPKTPSCDPAYPDVCIAPYPPDLDCGEIGYSNFKVIGDDLHGFDGDKDGIGCEVGSYKPTTQPPSPDCSGNARCIVGKVTQVIDGDTIKVDEQSIRFALAFAPELNEFGGDTAKEFIEEICPVGSIATVDEDDGQTDGSYDRIVGVIYCNGVNLNEELVDSSLGYLSTDLCDKSEFSSHAWTIKHGCVASSDSESTQECDESYPDVCIAVYPPDLDCGEIGYSNFKVIGDDPHGFDGDKDGIGCES